MELAYKRYKKLVELTTKLTYTLCLLLTGFKNYVGGGFDVIVTPSLLGMLVKLIWICIPLNLRPNHVLYLLSLDNNKPSEKEKDYLNKLSSHAIDLIKIMLSTLSKLSHSYYFAWRYSKVNLYILKKLMEFNEKCLNPKKKYASSETEEEFLKEDISSTAKLPPRKRNIVSMFHIENLKELVDLSDNAKEHYRKHLVQRKAHNDAIEAETEVTLVNIPTAAATPETPRNPPDLLKSNVFLSTTSSVRSDGRSKVNQNVSSSSALPDSAVLTPVTIEMSKFDSTYANRLGSMDENSIENGKESLFGTLRNKSVETDGNPDITWFSLIASEKQDHYDNPVIINSEFGKSFLRDIPPGLFSSFAKPNYEAGVPSTRPPYDSEQHVPDTNNAAPMKNFQQSQILDKLIISMDPQLQ
ncbi:unnamed protein product [[Candida] boidinii]|nr:unnamed protein product [[Candida] boidinii]